MGLDLVGPEAVVDDRAVLRQQLPQLHESEGPSHVGDVQDVAGRVEGWGRGALPWGWRGVRGDEGG